MDSTLSADLTTLRDEFSKGSVENTESVMETPLEPPTVGEPAELEVQIAPIESEFPAPSDPVAPPLYTPPTAPLAAETLPGLLAAEQAFDVQNMKLSEFVNWLAEDVQRGNTMVKTLAAEMSLAGFSASPPSDLTLAAAMWGKKNYQGQNAEETRNLIMKEATPVALRAEMDVFSSFEAESPTVLLAETRTATWKPWAQLAGLVSVSSLVTYVITSRKW